MHALPPDLEACASACITGIGCPDCPGTLEVRVEGDCGHLRFECRIGHVYSAEGLLEEKEESAEERLWAAVLSFEEMAVTLDDLGAHAARHGRPQAQHSYQERQARARALAAALRQLAEQDRPLRLQPTEPPVLLTQDDRCNP
jgi:two-component system, chemotaxis family, protein-glutamate methylesterase/glutaminase